MKIRKYELGQQKEQREQIQPATSQPNLLCFRLAFCHLFHISCRKDDNTNRRQNDNKRPFVDEQISSINNAILFPFLYTHRELL